MPKYLAVYFETKRYERIIEAPDLDEAHDIAEYSDIEDVVEDNEYYDWDLTDIREIKDETKSV